MSRRSGQVQTGCIQKDGNWYVVRYWQDVAGQGRRQRVREKICPLSGPGKLSASERQRKAKEIIAASGANSVEHRQSAHSVTFQEQAVTWLSPRSRIGRAIWRSGSIRTLGTCPWNRSTTWP